MASGAELSAIVRLARACESEGVRTVLAQLVSVEGSHYRRPGARMLIAEDGRSAGAISAGCLETDLRNRMAGVLSSGRSESLEYDSRTFEDLVWGLGSGCNGKVGVLLSPFEGALRETLVRAAEILERGGKVLLATALAGAPGSELGPGEVRLLECSGGVFAEPASEFFLDEISPPVSLLVAGAGPDAVPLVRFALDLGWRVAIQSPRDRAHLEERFRGLEVELAGGLDRGGPIPVHSKTAAVVMSHSFNDDAAALGSLLPLGLPYLGVLGPRDRTARLLRACGAPAGSAAKVHSPAGMNFGAETAEEIALSIVSEIQAEFAKALRRPAGAEG